MSFIGADLFGLDNKPTYPSAYDYYRSPTLENARKLLDAAGFYVPYEATRRAERLAADLATATAAATEASSLSRRGPGASRGGGKRPRPRASSSASPPPAPEAPADAFSIFQRADFLHDIHIGASINSIVSDRLLFTSVNIPEGLRRRLREHCTSRDAGAYTRQAVATLDEHFGFSGSLINVVRIKPDTLGAVFAINRQCIVADTYMRSTVTKWLAPNGSGVAELVFDGILEEPLERPAKKGIHEEGHLRSLATCAFLQWMIGEWPAPYDFLSATREIRFLTGTFQTLDVAGHDAFLNRWVGYLRRDASALKSVKIIRIGRIETDAVPSGTANVALAPGDGAALIVHGRRVPFIAEPTQQQSPSPSLSSPSPSSTKEAERLASFFRYAPARQVTYAKRDLEDMFQDYITLTDTQRTDPRVETVVNQVIAVNSFRDAFKADVALARGAVYLTVDRLALVYYELRRRALGAAGRGFALLTSKDNGGTMELKAYRS
jgi:hypothetical protein